VSSTGHAGMPPLIKNSVKHEHKQLAKARKKKFPSKHEHVVPGGKFAGKVSHQRGH
jgi:hypothetical protein